MFLEILKRFTLRPVVRVIVQIAKEHAIVFLPVGKFSRHGLRSELLGDCF